uniref:ribosomal protein S3 n=1 Tax=Perenniporia fraxinea TaxID=1350006 RepID=UPI0028E0A128|nr:ribosomal protein S3 [Perenniporia fraxinea]WFS78701.1 ribosomal protein S3 [Perenniporia fraxinea]
MNKTLLPINNHYSNIDLFTLSTSSTLKRNKIEKSPILEIAKYNHKLLNNSLDSLILNSKLASIPLAQSDGGSCKPSYYDKIDMLTPQKKDIEISIQKYLKSFNTLDIPLAQNKTSAYEFRNSKISHTLKGDNVSQILEYSFYEMSSVISTPYFQITPKNVIINLFYFVLNKNKRTFNKNFLELNLLKLQGLSSKLSHYFKKPVKLELTQLYSVSHNSQILIHILGKLGLFRRNSFTRIIGRFLKHQSNKFIFRSNRIFKYSKLSTILTGVNIKLGGRLMRGKIVPRRTVKKIQYGSLARSKSNYITNARLTQKNKRGSFSFTVSIGHRFF